MSEADKRYIDVQSALARVGGNEGLYKRLLGKFETSIDIAKFNEDIDTKNYVEAGEIVHAAKGVAGNLSLTVFFAASSKLMDQLRNGGTPNDEDVALFRQLFDETKSAVNAYLGV
ncbi:MAG: Hpt domain-containing protein [Clostridiales Family XIII bacterium]|jgi:HPt (histidine-containing phosphotransfer) domain-containing protein|nr:Hpt domain-containing protein [Clostridiales Family XIII bacterium]